MEGKKLESLRKQLDVLLTNGFIQKSDKDFGSSVFMVPNCNGSDYRMVIDARMTNTAIKGKVHPIITNIDEIVQTLSSEAYWLTQVDLAKCFFSMSVSKRVLDSGINNFICPLGVFQCNRAQTGNLSIPAHLYSYLHEYLENDLEGNYSPLVSPILTFYDDLNMFSHRHVPFEHHLSALRELLQRVARSGFKINLDKSRFCENLSETDFDVLGFKISYKSIEPNPKKLQALRELECPKNLKKLQSFLGSVQFFRKQLPLKLSGCLSLLSSGGSTHTSLCSLDVDSLTHILPVEEASSSRNNSTESRGIHLYFHIQK